MAAASKNDLTRLKLLFDVPLNPRLFFFPVLLELLLQLAYSCDGVYPFLCKRGLLLQPFNSKADLGKHQLYALGCLLWNIEGLLALRPEEAVGRGGCSQWLLHVR